MFALEMIGIHLAACFITLEFRKAICITKQRRKKINKKWYYQTHFFFSASLLSSKMLQLKKKRINISFFFENINYNKIFTKNPVDVCIGNDWNPTSCLTHKGRLQKIYIYHKKPKRKKYKKTQYYETYSFFSASIFC